jgi:hypothetical protein
MNPVTLPISMVARGGKGVLLATGVIGLILMLALASRRDPTVRNPTI